MIVIGYTKSTVNLVDSYTGKYQTHPLRNFLASWKTLGNMSIVGQGKAEKPPSLPTEDAISSVSPAVLGSCTGSARQLPHPDLPRPMWVRLLVGVARSFGVNLASWQTQPHWLILYIIYTYQY
jgi:hypothetical protein